MSALNFPIRIVHPEHGAMHVYDSTDLKKHEGLGWAVESPVIDEPSKKRGRPKKAEA